MSELKLSYEFTMASGDIDWSDCDMHVEVDGRRQWLGTLGTERRGLDYDQLEDVAKLMCDAPAMRKRIAELEAERGKLRAAMRGLVEIDFSDAVVACQQWVRRKEDAEEALKGGV